MAKLDFMKTVEVRAQVSPWASSVELLIRDGNAYATQVVMEELPEAMSVNPSLKISRTAAQTLMDDLWMSGLRPTEGTGSAGSLRATEKHLNDMRKIAFKGLGLQE